jgi:V-type H+-transporting ATPase subunit F
MYGNRWEHTALGAKRNENDGVNRVLLVATPISVIEESFRTLSNRDDIAIILINQHVRIHTLVEAAMEISSCVYAVQVAEEIRHLLNSYDKTIPTILEIPSKDMPYDPSKDYIMKRVNNMLGE